MPDDPRSPGFDGTAPRRRLVGVGRFSGRPCLHVVFRSVLMQCNLGGVDRGVRAVLGLAIIGWGVWVGSWWGALGAVPLITAVVAFCPAYVPFGLRTCSGPEKG